MSGSSQKPVDLSHYTALCHVYWKSQSVFLQRPSGEAASNDPWAQRDETMAPKNELPMEIQEEGREHLSLPFPPHPPALLSFLSMPQTLCGPHGLAKN